MKIHDDTYTATPANHINGITPKINFYKNALKFKESIFNEVRRLNIFTSLKKQPLKINY